MRRRRCRRVTTSVALEVVVQQLPPLLQRLLGAGCPSRVKFEMLSKPSEIRNGTVQLSARWKIKLPLLPQQQQQDSRDGSDELSTTTSPFIFKGYIRADPPTTTLTMRRSPVSAEMKGSILTVNTEQIVGKFEADLLATDIPDEELHMGDVTR